MPCNEYPIEETVIDRVARDMMDEWTRVEGKRPNISYVATFADMARVIVKKYRLDEPVQAC